VNPLIGTLRLRAPAHARAGETIEIRLFLDHLMDSGRRRNGSAVLRQMLANLCLLLNGREIARLAFGDGASPNPFHVFHVQIPGPCETAAIWTAENGRQARVSHRVAA
jgi:sulfur-oxidizing protein SoxZ